MSHSCSSHEGCHCKPRECHYSICDHDGDDRDGHPIHLYWAGLDCPISKRHVGQTPGALPMQLVKLLRANPRGLTTLEIAKALNCLNPSTTASQARALGFDIDCKFLGLTENKRKTYLYTLKEREAAHV